MSKGEWPRTAAIFGCAGPQLSAEEHEFFRAVGPAGFILFARNCVDPQQLRHLVAELREAADAPQAPVLIDQEGGRVVRLPLAHWRHPPSARRFGDLYERSAPSALEACRLNARLIAADLRALGISVDCIPVLDVPVADAHDIIGDRAFARDPVIIAVLGRAVAEGLLAGGVAPVIKHIPGHGRARADSHEALPRVGTARAELERSDFAPFRALADLPWAMTAHVLYTELDAQEPATTSRVIIEEVIRGHIGFRGALLSDDLSMQALRGTLEERAQRALAAGCDVALHCNGRLDEMREVARGAAEFRAGGRARFEAALAAPPPPDALDWAAARDRLAGLLAPVA